MRSTALFLCITLAGVPLPARAQWLSQEEAPLILEKSREQIYVHADGSYESASESVFAITKAEGIEEVKLYHLLYDPNTTQIQITEAKTINGAEETALSPVQIEDKPVAPGDAGLINLHRITIPFSSLEVGSKVAFKMTRKHKAPFVPGLFHLDADLARSYFTLSDVTEIRSEIPLTVKHQGASDIAIFQQSREQNLQKITITLARPVSREVRNEPFAAYVADTIPRIEIGATSEWSALARPLAEKMERSLQEPLPPALAAIAAEAAKAPSAAQKAHMAMKRLIESVRYLGDWRTEQNYYLPRTLAEIETSKQGDCKDFSLALVALLRKLGIAANVAWVQRGPSQFGRHQSTPSRQSLDPLLPGLNYFNHAIVTAEIDGQTRWLDPTNPAANINSPYSDIADRAALVLSAQTTALSHVPKSENKASVEATAYYAFRQQGKADAMAEISVTESLAKEIERAAIRAPEEQRKFALLPLLEPPGTAEFLGLPREIEPSSEPPAVAGTERRQFTFVLGGKNAKTALGNGFALPPISLLGRLSFPVANRVTGVDLGDPGKSRKTVYLTNFQLQGEMPPACRLQSKWVDVSRSYQKRRFGVVVEDEIHVKQSPVSHDDLLSPQFDAFQKQIAGCLDPQTLVYQWALPGPGAKPAEMLPNPLIRDRKNLLTRAEDITADSDQQYEQYTYAKMLAYAALQDPHPKFAPVYGELGYITRRQAYLSNRRYEAMGRAESETLFDMALKLDPLELKVLIQKGYAALETKLYGEAQSFADTAVKKYPDSTAAQILFLQTKRRIAVTAELQVAIHRQVITKANELLADPRTRCRACVLELLSEIYAQANDTEHSEKIYREIIQLRPKSAWAPLNFAEFLNQRDRYEEAVGFARQATKNSNIAMAHTQLSWALAGMAIKEFIRDRESEKGIRLCEEALEQDQRNRNCVKILGYAYDIKNITSTDRDYRSLSQKFKALGRSLESAPLEGPQVPLLTNLDVAIAKVNTYYIIRPTTDAPPATVAASPPVAPAPLVPKTANAPVVASPGPEPAAAASATPPLAPTPVETLTPLPAIPINANASAKAPEPNRAPASATPAVSPPPAAVSP